MSALAKVFVVFVFVLSVAFFGTSATLFKTRMDWKTAYLQLQKEVFGDPKAKEEGDKAGKLGQLTAHIGTLKSQIDEDVKTIQNLKFTQDQQAKDLQRLTGEVNEEKGKVEMAQNAAKAANLTNQQLAKDLATEKQRLTEKDDLINKTKTDLDTAVADAAEARKERDRLRIDLEKAQTDLGVARTEYKDSSEKVQSLELLVKAYEVKYPAIKSPLLPAIDAMVNAVDLDEKLVVLSVGRDDNVQTGFEFTVYRGDEYIGKVQVIKVYPNLAGARIVVLKDGAQIQRGDKASTRLGS